MPFLKSGRVAPERTGPEPRALASQGAEPGPHSPPPTPERRPGPPRRARPALEGSQARGSLGEGEAGTPSKGRFARLPPHGPGRSGRNGRTRKAAPALPEPGAARRCPGPAEPPGHGGQHGSQTLPAVRSRSKSRAPRSSSQTFRPGTPRCCGPALARGRSNRTAPPRRCPALPGRGRSPARPLPPALEAGRRRLAGSRPPPAEAGERRGSGAAVSRRAG